MVIMLRVKYHACATKPSQPGFPFTPYHCHASTQVTLPSPRLAFALYSRNTGIVLKHMPECDFKRTSHCDCTYLNDSSHIYQSSLNGANVSSEYQTDKYILK